LVLRLCIHIFLRLSGQIDHLQFEITKQQTCVTDDDKDRYRYRYRDRYRAKDKDKGLLVVRGPGNCNSHRGIRIRIHGLPTAFLRFTSHHSPLGNRLFEFPLPKLLILINESVVVRPLCWRKDYPAPKKNIFGLLSVFKSLKCQQSSPDRFTIMVVHGRYLHVTAVSGCLRDCRLRSLRNLFKRVTTSLSDSDNDNYALTRMQSKTDAQYV